MDVCVTATDAGQTILNEAVSPICTRSPNILYIISGTFNTIFLYILAFNTQSRTLSIHSRYDASGPHQYLAFNTSSNRLFATTWALPPSLSSWAVSWSEDGEPSLKAVDQVDITATSSYIALTGSHIYSAGGPTGEVHSIDGQSHGFGTKVQEMVYVEQDELEKTDKTRKALRYGSHAIEFNTDGKAFVPHLGHNSIWTYQLDAESGKLDFKSETKSVRFGDGPRHVIPSPNGKYLYSVTEHTSYLDVYEIKGFDLLHRQSASLIPTGAHHSSYRGDTLRLSRLSPSSPGFLFATTRGMTSSTRGYLSSFQLTPEGLLASLEPVDLYQTLTSGGKANAIEVAPLWAYDTERKDEKEWFVLTDDEQGWVFVMEWDPNAPNSKRGGKGKFEEVSRVKLDEGSLASHAVWLG